MPSTSITMPSTIWSGPAKPRHLTGHHRRKQITLSDSARTGRFPTYRRSRPGEDLAAALKNSKTAREVTHGEKLYQHALYQDALRRRCHRFGTAGRR